MSTERATAAPVPADSAARGEGLTLAGLIDLLDRADGDAPAHRPRPRRTSAHRSYGRRTGGRRAAPLRSVQPAPVARFLPDTPRAHVLPEPWRPPVAGLAELVRRAAMWGAGPKGEHLAWRSRPAAAAGIPALPPVEPQAGAARRPGRVRTLLRRAALWGSGQRGEYLAWGGPAGAPARREVDPPVVLRELPSTPTVQPVAPSPAAALLPRGPASSAGSRGIPPVPRGAVAVPGVGPGGPPERSRDTGWPNQPRRSPEATGRVRTRGDPVPGAARGSPPPARRSRSPGSPWTSFP